MRGLLVLPDGDAEMVEGDWNASFEIGTLIEAEYITVELPSRSCDTCPDLAIWVSDDEPDVVNGVVNLAASRLANRIVFGKALITAMVKGEDFDFIELEVDEMLRLAARMVLAEHRQLKQGEADE